MSKINVAIIGATGFTGSELVRILNDHPDVQIAAITSESHKGKKFSDIHPAFYKICDQELISVKEIDKTRFEVVFLALP
ncbi:MAG: NAD-dependent epimerase/dehydratase family protein, partial [Flavobacteriales bacterium]